MIWVFFFVFFCYAILIITLSAGFRKVKDFTSENKKSSTRFSVIIPFRNEAENLPKLLNSITELKYPKELFEIIFVNDASEDNSLEIIESVLDTISLKTEITRTDIFVIDNIRSSNSPKKDAITTAIKQAKHNWIITTDADCILPKKWLQKFDDFIKKNKPKMIVAPVNYKVKKSFLERFQLLDFLSMQGSTIGGFGINFPFMCNGANLAYKKEDFIHLKGFEGNNNLASGDDVFLFEKFIRNNPNDVWFLKSKEAIVQTFPVNSWSALINQRVRWAAKTGNLKSIKVKLIGVLILLVNTSILFSFFGFLTGSISYKYYTTLFLLKLIIDLFLFMPTIKFFGQQKPFWKSYFLSSFLYPFFNVLVIFKAMFFNYNWKGRSFKK